MYIRSFTLHDHNDNHPVQKFFIGQSERDGERHNSEILNEVCEGDGEATFYYSSFVEVEKCVLEAREL